MAKIAIELEEDDLIALLHGCVQSSCGYNRNHVEENLWHLHCCDYNYPVQQLVTKLDTTEFKGEEHRAYLESLKKVVKEEDL